MSSSDSSSEDENMKNLREAVDSELINDSFFNESLKNKEEVKIAEAPKSQRYLDVEEEVFQSDLNVSKSMQDFISKKLSKIIDNQVEFVEVKPKKLKDKEVDRLKLLNDSQDFVKLEDPGENQFLKDRKKIPIVKRKVEEDEIPDSQKQKAAAINIDQIQEETKSWTSRKKGKLFEYKEKNSVGYLREPTNEFTKMRNKNNWMESKISTAKFYGKGLGDVSK